MNSNDQNVKANDQNVKANTTTNRGQQNAEENKIKMENTETKNLPKLETSINSTPQELEVTYTVKNTLDKPIYLFNVLWDMTEDGKAFRAEKQLYVSLQEDKTLLAAKKIPKLPAIRSVEFREIPYVTKVDAGGEFSETINLPVPVEEYNPYFPKTDDSEVKEVLADNVQFEIQFIPEVDSLELKVTGIENVWSVWHPDIFGNVETLRSKPSPVSVKVNKRLDEFESI